MLSIVVDLESFSVFKSVNGTPVYSKVMYFVKTIAFTSILISYAFKYRLFRGKSGQKKPRISGALILATSRMKI